MSAPVGLGPLWLLLSVPEWAWWLVAALAVAGLAYVIWTWRE